MDNPDHQEPPGSKAIKDAIVLLLKALADGHSRKGPKAAPTVLVVTIGSRRRTPPPDLDDEDPGSPSGFDN
jgi:hypothetical protein